MRENTRPLVLIPLLFLLLLPLNTTVTDSVTVKAFLVVEVENPNPFAIPSYQARLVLTSTSGIDFNVMRDDASDLFVTDYYGRPVYYWIEYFNKTEGKLILWFDTGTISAESSAKYVIYYGGENPYPEHNDPTGVFPFFYDFRSSGVDTTYFTVYGDLSTTVTSEYTTISAADNSYVFLVTKGLVDQPARIIACIASYTSQFMIGLTDEQDITNTTVIQSVFAHQKNQSVFQGVTYSDNGNVTTILIDSYPANGTLYMLDWLGLKTRITIDGQAVAENSINVLQLPSYIKGFIGIPANNSGSSVSVKWIALAKAYDQDPIVRLLPSESVQQGTIRVADITITRTYSPPAPVAPPTTQNPFTQGASAGQKAIFTVIPTAIVVYLTLRGWKLHTSMALGASIIMLAGILLNETTMTITGAVIIAISLALAYTRE